MKRMTPVIFILLLLCGYISAQSHRPLMFGIGEHILDHYVEMEEGVYDNMNLQIFSPHNLQLSFTTTCPTPDNKTICFAAAAAFTGKDLTSICGPYVEDGIAGKNFYGGNMNGYIAMWDNHVVIKPVKDSLSYYKQKAIKNKGCFFEQCLLVDNHQMITCKLFNNERQRRAMVIKNGKPLIVESVKRVMIDDFSKALVAFGAESALYLDMGGWSYGWYTNCVGQTETIGVYTMNTKHQSNWIIFKYNE